VDWKKLGVTYERAELLALRTLRDVGFIHGWLMAALAIAFVLYLQSATSVTLKISLALLGFLSLCAWFAADISSELVRMFMKGNSKTLGPVHKAWLTTLASTTAVLAAVQYLTTNIKVSLPAWLVCLTNIATVTVSMLVGGLVLLGACGIYRLVKRFGKR